MDHVSTLYVLLKRNGPAHELMRGIRECRRPDAYPRIVLQEPTPEDCRWLNTQSSRGVLGVIGDFTDLAMENLLKDLRVPKINVSAQTEETTMIRVVIDNAAVGRLAAEYFVNAGYRHFAYVGYEAYYWSRLRCEGFQQVLSASRGATFRNIEADGVSTAVLRRLPQPLAVLAGDDRVGIQVIELARKARLSVPNAIAVLGVNNDDVLCEMAAVPLSSIDDNGRQMGVEAMNILDRIRHGQQRPAGETLVPPNGVVARASTEALALDDTEVAVALKLIRREACNGLTVQNLMERLGVSRGTIDRRFREALGCTPYREIRRVRFETARRLLAQTRLKVAAVAQRCGYRDAKRFAKEFRAEAGSPPTAWRKAHSG
jgi:LacI family transcriptional regulator